MFLGKASSSKYSLMGARKRTKNEFSVPIISDSPFYCFIKNTSVRSRYLSTGHWIFLTSNEHFRIYTTAGRFAKNILHIFVFVNDIKGMPERNFVVFPES